MSAELLSEIRNGNSPHEAKGTPYQAWSVAEVIRVYNSLEGDLNR